MRLKLKIRLLTIGAVISLAACSESYPGMIYDDSGSKVQVSWTMIIQCCMRTFCIVAVNIVSNSLTQFTWSLKFIDVNQLTFQAAKPSLNHNVVCPACFSVHALLYLIFFQPALIIFAGKLTALVRINDFRLAVLSDSFLHCFQNRCSIQRIRQFIAHDNTNPESTT